MTFKKDIEDIISTISSKFQDNELAYLALTSKVELPLRDRIAFELHKKYGDKYLICREWKSKEIKSSDRVDLAIVEKETEKVLCLIEFKAKSVVRMEKEFTRHLAEDLIKIRDLAKDDNVELYYIYFNNVIDSKNEFEAKYVNSVKYISYLNKNIKNETGTVKVCKDNWKKHLSEAKLSEDKSEHITINTGVYYGRAVTIEVFIYGHVSKTEIINL
jgi:hypothetical protein